MASTTIPSLRTAASLLLVAPTSQVLFMLRPAGASFPGTHVFPGGAFDKETDPSLSYTALRETYEETGLLLGPQPTTQPVVHAVGEYPSYDSAFKHVFGLNPRPSNPSFWSSQSEKRILGLERFSQWTSPPTIPKRFSTQFYLCRVPQPFEFPELPPLSSSFEASEQSPEVELLEWLTPLQALDAFKQGKIKLMPPQFYLMTMILEHGLDGAIERLRNRVFTPTVINKHGDGRVEMDWGQGESGIVKFGKNGVADSIEIVKAKI